MLRTALRAAFVIGLLALSGSAAAQTVEYAKKTVIDFNDVTLEGELTKPEGAYLLNRKRTKFRSLIKLREDFFKELETSVDNL